MASWITVYCRKSVGAVSPDQLLAGITDKDPSASAGVDYWTLAESYAVEEDAVDTALEALRVEAEGPGFEVYSVRYCAAPRLRPVFVRRWADEARVRRELDEAAELRKPSASTSKLLEQTREVIGIELGATQLNDFGIVVAYEIARYLAQIGDGLICDLQDGWTIVRDRGFEDL